MDRERLKKEAEKKIDSLVEQGISSTATIDALDKLVDIVKDISEIEKMEKHKYQGEYSEYGNYGRNYMEGRYNEGNYREGNYSEGEYGRRGNFREGYQEGNYGRRMRDSRGRFKGHEMIDEMDRRYSNYSEGREQYGAEGKSIEELEYMMDAVYDFIKMLKQDVRSQKEMQIIDKGIKKLENV